MKTLTKRIALALAGTLISGLALLAGPTSRPAVPAPAKTSVKKASHHHRRAPAAKPGPAPAARK